MLYNKLLFLGRDFNTDLPPTSLYIGDAVEPTQARLGPKQPDGHAVSMAFVHLTRSKDGRQGTKDQNPKQSMCRVGLITCL